MTTMRRLILFTSLVAIFGLNTSKAKVVTCYYDAGGSYWNGYDKTSKTWTDAAARYEVTDIDTKSCTHLIYSFAHLDTTTWTIKSSDKALDLPLKNHDVNHPDWGSWNEGRDNFKAFTDLKPKSVKKLISIGGAKDSKVKYGDVSKYSALASDSANRKKFNTGVVKFLKKHNFDGLDLDWEFPGNKDFYGNEAVDKDNFATWVKELRTAFDKSENYNNGKKLLLTAAVGGSGDAHGYAYAKLYKDLDYVHIMSYDFNGWWDKVSTKDNTEVGHNAPMSKTSDLIKNWIDNSNHKTCSETDKICLCTDKICPKKNKKCKYNEKICPTCEPGQKTCPMDKLVLGVGLYGRSFKLTDSANTKPGAAVTGPGDAGTYPKEAGLLSYLDICKHIKTDTDKWTLVKTTGNVGAYAHHDGQWVGFDDVILAKEKANYAKTNGLAGVLFWSIDYADWNNKCGGGKYPIVTAMGGILNPKVKSKSAKLN